MPNDLPDNRIRNAEVRYREKVESRLTNAVVRRRKKIGLEDEEKNRPFQGQNREVDQNNALSSIYKQTITENDIPYIEGDEQLLIIDPPKKPNFPYFILTIALFKDFIDIPANLSVVGSFLPIFTTFIVWTILFFWMLGEMNGKWWKKFIIKRLILWMIGVAVVEALPFGSIIPATTILVLMIYYKEKKIVKIFNQILEEIHKQQIFPIFRL